MSLNTTTMLAALNISMWTGRAKDRNAARTVESAHHTDINAGAYIKHLVHPAALAEIGTIAGEARRYHYTHTLPWLDGGVRMLPAVSFMDYTSDMRKRRVQFEQRANQFVSTYTKAVEAARNRLGTLFNINDYPSVSAISSAFSFGTRILPTPDAGDFRVNLVSKELDEVRAACASDLDAVAEGARQDVYKRIKDAVTHMAERLGDDKAVFRDTLVENVRELVTVVPRLNITGDKEIDKLISEISTSLTVHSPDVLRDNKIIRARTAERALKILDNMAGYRGGVNGGLEDASRSAGASASPA